MALLGTAALAMWWDVPPEMRVEFEHWHTHEHFVERLGIPGFLRASRWRSSERDGGIFVMYELADHAVLSSPAYLRHLNAPSPWSRTMMPHHHGMVRCQCHVLASHGAAVGGHAMTVRLPSNAAISPIAGRGATFGKVLAEAAASIVNRPGVCGAHLLRHERPAMAQTTEQKIRGGDREADWVFVSTGYDGSALSGAVLGALVSGPPEAAAAMTGADVGRYTLAHSATPRDVA